MDSKEPLLPFAPPPPDTMKPHRRASQTRFQLAAAVILFSLFWLARTWNCGHEHLEAEDKVALEVHIMSKCPDAQACVEKLIMPAMSNISEKVDFRLSFIGRVTDEDDGVQCMHGQTECLGNILMLCAAAEYPDPMLSLGFANCLLTDYAEIPAQSLAEDCALEHGLDFGVLNECMSRDTGAHGMGLLRESVLHSQQLGVATSCTIRLDHKTRCVLDGGRWRDCDAGAEPEDLIADIDRLFDEARGWTY